MAALSITAEDVVHISGPAPRIVRSGEAVARGEVVFLDDGAMMLGLADNSASAKANGVALGDVGANSELLIAISGSRVNIGATTVAGTAYCLSAAAAGAIVPITDLTNDDHPVFLFWGSGTAEVTLAITRSPVPIPPA
jgi:hypothetical protein